MPNTFIPPSDPSQAPNAEMVTVIDTTTGDQWRVPARAVEAILAAATPAPDSGAGREGLRNGRGPREVLTDALMRGPGRYSRSGSQALAERLLLALEDAGYVIGEARP